MSEEVKEILEKVNCMINFDKNLIGWQINDNEETISKVELKQLLDYITDLKKEKEILKARQEIGKTCGLCPYYHYKLRCEKAIELLNDPLNHHKRGFISDLKNILQGSDKE